MKKRIIVFFTCLILTFSSIPLCFAKNDMKTNSLDIFVTLYDDGSAKISERWDIETHSGTEWYLVQENLGDIEISDFSVTDEKGTTFTYIDDWDIDASRQEKAQKCGINETSNGCELCWGIGDYGSHIFTATYKMTNFVKRFSDYNGFNQRLINPGLSAPPKRMTVTIQKDGLDFTTENTKIWAFGFDGEIYVVDGKIIAKSNNAFNKNNYANIMARFDLNMFNSSSTKSYSFEKLREKAFENSDYLDEEDDFGPFDFLIFLIPISIIFIIIYIGIKNKKTVQFNKKDLKEIDYFRDIPCNKDLIVSNFLFSLYNPKNENSIIGAYILKWIYEGNITIIKNKKSKLSLYFEKNTISDKKEEKKLYSMLLQASDDDNTLEEKEFSKWSKKHYDEIFNWTKSIKNAGETVLRNNNKIYLKKDPAFFGLVHFDNWYLNEDGTQDLKELLGLKKYLEDFTIINEREAVEVEIWDDYLIYAALFGIADKVAKDFKDIYPKYFENPIYETNDVDLFSTMIWVNHFSHSSYKSAVSGRNSAMAASGGGGSTSIGGGGGFSGGGCGGGGR